MLEELQSVFLEKLVGISRKTTSKSKIWNSQPIEFPQRAMKVNFSHLKTLKKFKLVEYYPDEEMLPVALRKHKF